MSRPINDRHTHIMQNNLHVYFYTCIEIHHTRNAREIAYTECREKTRVVPEKNLTV